LKYFLALFFETFDEGFRIEIGICKALVDAGVYAFILCRWQDGSLKYGSYSKGEEIS
jgi:hypothetical protein